MRYMLIEVNNLFLSINIKTEIFTSKTKAFNCMKKALYYRLEMDNNEDMMGLLESGVEFSNAVLHHDNAYIYQGYGELYLYHHWKIVEI